MKRLAIVAPHFAEYVVEYARAMSDRHAVLAVVDRAQIGMEYSGREVPPDAAPLLTMNKFATPADMLRLLKAIRAFRPDVLHFQEAAGTRRALFNLVTVTAFGRRVPIVVTVHDPAPHEGRDAAIHRRTARINALVRARANAIIVHGSYCAGVYRERYLRPGQLLIESQHGVILEPDTFSVPAAASSIRLLFFGRMEAYKGIDVLLSACQLLHEEGVRFELTVAGRGPELDRFQSALEVLPEVTVKNGFIESGELIAAIQAAECILLPYLSATQSGVAAAAFAGRRYVVASDTGGLRDVVQHGDNGLLVPPGDAAALASTLRALAGDAPLRRRLLEGAAQTASGPLNWRTIASRLDMELFEASNVGE